MWERKHVDSYMPCSDEAQKDLNIFFFNSAYFISANNFKFTSKFLHFICK